MSKKRSRVPITLRRPSKEAIANARAEREEKAKASLRDRGLQALRVPGVSAPPGMLNAGHLYHLEFELGHSPSIAELHWYYAEEMEIERTWFEAHRDELQAEIDEERKARGEGQAEERGGAAEDQGGKEEQAQRTPSDPSDERRG